MSYSLIISPRAEKETDQAYKWYQELDDAL